MKEKIVELENIYKWYRHKKVLNNISLVINTGDRIGIVGSNGEGKTTLCETIAQLRLPNKGKVWRNYQKRIGMQLQDSHYPKGITGNDILEFYLKSYKLTIPQKTIDSILQYLDLQNFMDTSILKLSGGQQQKINIFFALVINPDLVILDELGNGLDLEIKDNVYYLIKNYLEDKEKALILISHNMQEIELFCDELIFLLHGQIQSRLSIADILKKYQSVEEYVKKQFKEYHGLVHSQNKQQGAANNEDWKKLWDKNNEKK